MPEQNSSEELTLFNQESDTTNDSTSNKIYEKPLTEDELKQLDFYSIKTGDPVTVSAITEMNNPVEVLQLNRFREELSEGQIIFLVLGGDRSKAHVDWETGLKGIGKIVKKPYDVNYEGRNFKLQIEVVTLLEDNIKKEDLVPYRSTYNLPGISPMTKGEPNQALNAIEGRKAVGLVRAIMDKYPELETTLLSIFDERFIANVKSSHTYLFEKRQTFEERKKSIKVTHPSNDGENETPQLPASSNNPIYNPKIENIKGSFEMDSDPIKHMKNYINIGKNIILMGAPGTGKTTLAQRASEEGVRTNYIDGYILSTSTDDWSTFDTIGGYMPNPNDSGKLIFNEGIVLKSIRQKGTSS